MFQLRSVKTYKGLIKTGLVLFFCLIQISVAKAEGTFKLNLKAGTTFISIPIGKSWTVQEIFSKISATYKAAALWDPVTQRYLFAYGNPAADQFTNFEFARGYWLRLDNPTTTSITLTGTTPANYTLQLKKGWNQIGCPVNRAIPVEEALLPLKLNTDYSSVQRYNTLTGTYQIYSGAKKEFTSLTPGEGYWVAMLKDAAWLIAKPDITPPTTPVVTDDGSYTSSFSKLHAKWVSEDTESAIVEYQYSIGTGKPGNIDMVPWTSITTNEVTVTGLSLSGESSYYFNVKAKNSAGLWSVVGSSDGIKPDIAPSICSIKPLDKTTFTEGDSISIVACVMFYGADKAEVQVSIDGKIIKPWFVPADSCFCTSNGSGFTYPWVTKIGDSGYHVIKVEARDGRVETVSKQSNIYIYRKPSGPPL